ncbi:MAG: hypothetical protein ACYC0Z_12980 [Acidobacteriaceae bacterium]
MTWHDLVRRYFPTASDSQCDKLLWNCTCFPFGTAETVERQIKAHAASGKNVVDVLDTPQLDGIPIFCAFEPSGNRLTGRGLWRVVSSPRVKGIVPGQIERIGDRALIWSRKPIKPGTIVSPRKIHREYWGKP